MLDRLVATMLASRGVAQREKPRAEVGHLDLLSRELLVVESRITEPYGGTLGVTLFGVRPGEVYGRSSL